jgi:hypothetical protein
MRMSTAPGRQLSRGAVVGAEYAAQMSSAEAASGRGGVLRPRLLTGVRREQAAGNSTARNFGRPSSGTTTPAWSRWSPAALEDSSVDAGVTGAVGSSSAPRRNQCRRLGLKPNGEWRCSLGSLALLGEKKRRRALLDLQGAARGGARGRATMVCCGRRRVVMRCALLGAALARGSDSEPAGGPGQ